MKRFCSLLIALAAMIVAPFLPTALALGVTMRTGAAFVASGNQDQRPFDWDGVLKMLDPDLSKFVYFLMKFADETVTDPKFHQFEDQDIPLWSQVNGGTLTSGTATISTDDGTIFFADARVMVPRTGEVFLVGAVSTNDLTGCTRGHSGTTNYALLDNDYLLVLGEIVYEMDTVGTVRTSVPTTVYNYCQTFRKPWSASNRDLATKKRTINDDVRDKTLCLRNLKRDMEHAFRFGTRYTTGSGSTTQMYTGGFEYFVTSNVYQANGQLTEPFLLAVCKDLFTYGTANKKLGFAGPEAMAQLAALGMLADTVISADDKDRNWLGMDIRQFISPFGTIDFLWDKTLTQGFADRVHLVDIDHISIATLQGRGLNYVEVQGRHTDGDTTFLDGKIGEYLADRGLKIDNEKVHGIIKGCTTVAPPA